MAEPEPDRTVEPEEDDRSHTALHDPRNVDLRWVEDAPKFGYTREDAYRVLAGLPPRGTVNVPLVHLNPPPNVRVTHDDRSPEEITRLFAGLHGPRRDRPPAQPEADPTDPTDPDDA